MSLAMSFINTFGRTIVGLDIYAMETKNADPKLFEGIRLCGGELHTDTTSFRGKVYESLVQWMTGDEVTLYQEVVPFDDLRKLADQFAFFFQENPDDVKAQELLNDLFYNTKQTDYAHTVDEVRNLSKFFNICLDNNLHLRGWW